jgi:hypothetical protein
MTFRVAAGSLKDRRECSEPIINSTRSDALAGIVHWILLLSPAVQDRVAFGCPASMPANLVGALCSRPVPLTWRAHLISKVQMGCDTIRLRMEMTNLRGVRIGQGEHTIMGY